jgi:hypothetical protein
MQTTHNTPRRLVEPTTVSEVYHPLNSKAQTCQLETRLVYFRWTWRMVEVGGPVFPEPLIVQQVHLLFWNNYSISSYDGPFVSRNILSGRAQYHHCHETE